MADVDAARAVAGLKELRRLTGNEDGAQRVAWTDTWIAARDWLRAELDGIDGVTVERDEAGNTWATLPGDRDRVRDRRRPPRLGARRRLARRRAQRGRRPRGAARARATSRAGVTLKLVDWADEEGARFGRTLLGSSACAGTLDPDSVRGLTDRDGVALPDALAAHGVDARPHGRVGRACSTARSPTSSCTSSRARCSSSSTSRSASCSARSACSATRVRFTGAHAHAGATPMHLRRDAFLAAARSALAWRDDAARRDDVRATTGIVKVSPGIVTAFNGTCEVSLDQRALDAGRARRHAGDGAGGVRADRRRGGLHGRVGADLGDRADPVRRRADRARRRRRSARSPGRATGCRAARCTTRPRWRA